MKQVQTPKQKLLLNVALATLVALASLTLIACAGTLPPPAAPVVQTVVVPQTVQVQQTVVSEKVVTATPAPTEAIKKVIRIAGFGPGEASFQPIWNEIKATYEKLHPDVEIKLEGIAYENLETQLIVEATGGTAPDIGQVDSLMDLRFAKLGMTTPLENLMSAQFKSDLDPSLLENSSYNGHVYAIPQSGVPHILWMNLDLAKKAGLDPNAPIKTWADFENAARAIAKLGKDDKGNQIYGFCTNTGGGLAFLTAFQAFPIFASFGNEWFDKDGKPTLTDPKAVAALTWMQQMVKDGVIGPPGVDIRDNRTLFAQGRCGFQVDNTGAVGIYRDLSGQGKDFDSHWKLIPWPAKDGDKGIGIYYAHTFVVFEQSKVKQEAVDFIQWLLTDKDMNAKYFDATGALPPTKSLLSTYNTDYAKAIAEQETSWKRPAPQYPDKLNEIFTFISVEMIKSLVEGQDPATALKAAETNLKSLLGL
ncbi:MAG TPA: sugar ABC transporter substrate-binding protein [Anaerolineae bacterium]|nr:sugar ABC transporter substrate-binding protein [Anaerolineae bacterium]